MDETIRRYLGWTIAVLMTVMAAGSFLFRYAGFIRLMDSVESVSLSDSVVKADEGQSSSYPRSSYPPSSYPPLSLAGGFNTRMSLRATREGLVRECGGSDLIGVLMIADAGVPSDGQVVADGVLEDGISADGVLEDGIAADGVPADGISADGVPADGISADGVPTDGISADGVPADGISADGVRKNRILVDGVPADRIDLGTIKAEARYRVVYEIDESGAVVASTYESLP